MALDTHTFKVFENRPWRIPAPCLRPGVGGAGRRPRAPPLCGAPPPSPLDRSGAVHPPPLTASLGVRCACQTETHALKLSKGDTPRSGLGARGRAAGSRFPAWAHSAHTPECDAALLYGRAPTGRYWLSRRLKHDQTPLSGGQAQLAHGTSTVSKNE